MPSAAQIARHTAEVASNWIALSIMWHLVIGAVLIGLAAGWRPGRRGTGLFLASLCASVATVAWLAGNPFNGSIFTLLAGGLAALALRFGPGGSRGHAPGWALVAGALMLGFGLVYPHFLAGPAALYLLAAPVGVIPCPTLAVVIGFSLLGDGLASRAWCWLLVAVGSFYAVFGVWRLGVALDVGLVLGTLAVGSLLTRVRTWR